jgi:hypothetical protein
MIVRILLIAALITPAYSASILTNPKTSCHLSKEAMFRPDIIEFGDFNCVDDLDCGLVIYFPKEYENTRFLEIRLLESNDPNQGLIAPLLTVDEGSRLASHLSGSAKFLTNLKFQITYEPSQGCSYWSTLALK